MGESTFDKVPLLVFHPPLLPSFSLLVSSQ